MTTLLIVCPKLYENCDNTYITSFQVNFENLMPGTDMGTVFNEFFTMCGPELMDMLEIKLNESGVLLNLINNLLPH